MITILFIILFSLFFYNSFFNNNKNAIICYISLLIFFINFRNIDYGRDYKVYLEQLEFVSSGEGFSNDLFINLLGYVDFLNSELVLNIFIALIQFFTGYYLLKKTNKSSSLLIYVLLPYGFLAGFDQLSSALAFLVLVVSLGENKNFRSKLFSFLVIFLIQPITSILFFILSSCFLFKAHFLFVFKSNKNYF